MIYVFMSPTAFKTHITVAIKCSIHRIRLSCIYLLIYHTNQLNLGNYATVPWICQRSVADSIYPTWMIWDMFDWFSNVSNRHNFSCSIPYRRIAYSLRTFLNCWIRRHRHGRPVVKLKGCCCSGVQEIKKNVFVTLVDMTKRMFFSHYLIWFLHLFTQFAGNKWVFPKIMVPPNHPFS